MKNIKVGILTINDDNNYGNRLQNYALQEFIRKYNIEVETIKNDADVFGWFKIKLKIKRILKKMLKYNFAYEFEKRRSYFKKFNTNIKFSKIKININKIDKNLGKQYDYFFAGSDQIWNPTFGRMSDIDFLTFAEEEKRNSFAASFGINKIPEEMKEYYKDRLKKFKNISVREDEGKKIIEDLTDRKDIKVLIDPTMLLNASEWDKVMLKPKKMQNEQYILNYFLGKLPEEIDKEIRKIAKENNCKIINILDPKDPFYVTGPSEFLYLEKNAFLICTDSFHSTIFAILYNRPVIVFNRNDKRIDMSSRLNTLLHKFKLEERYYKGKITKDLLKCNYKESHDILKTEIQKVEEFLTNVIGDLNGE